MITCRCRMCGSTFQTDETMAVDTCDYCGANNTLPMVSDDRLVKLFDRAAAYRLDNEFDRSSATYDSILEELPDNAEAHFGKVLCKFGLEYIQDDWSGVRNPVCHRMYETAVLEDEDYLAAVANAKPEAKEIYETVGYQIDYQEKKFKEEEAKVNADFDVYICNKEFDDRNRPTRDSEYAHSLYDYLRSRGYKVFMPSITLEGKDYQQYEPHIHAALKNVKAMLVVTTRREFVTWPWVKNEWNRYLDIVKTDSSRSILVCYDELDPLDIPRELSTFNFIDMSKPDYQDTLLSKLLDVVSPSGQPGGNEPAAQDDEIGFQSDATLSGAPESQGSIGNLFDTPQFQVKPEEPVAEEKEEVPEEVAEPAPAPKQPDDPAKQIAYLKAVKLKDTAKNADEFLEASAAFRELGGYKDSTILAEACKKTADEMRFEVIYVEAMRSYKRSATASDYARTKLMFDTIPGYKDADGKARECAILTNRLHKEEEKKRQEEKERQSSEAGQQEISEAQEYEEYLINENNKKQLKRQRILVVAIVAVAVLVAVIWSKPYWGDIQTFITSIGK